jgi:hypothetical protein
MIHVTLLTVSVKKNSDNTLSDFKQLKLLSTYHSMFMHLLHSQHLPRPFATLLRWSRLITTDASRKWMQVELIFIGSWMLVSINTC